MEAVSSIAGETIAAGLGLGVAAAAAFTSAPVSQGSNVRKHCIKYQMKDLELIYFPPLLAA